MDIKLISEIEPGRIIAMVDGSEQNPVVSNRFYKLGQPDPATRRKKAWARFNGQMIMLHPNNHCVDVTEQAEQEGWKF